MLIMGASYQEAVPETITDPIEKGYRRSEFDVTNQIDVSKTACVNQAVKEIFNDCFPKYSYNRIDQAFHDFDAIYSGKNPRYHACETEYHNLQHVLDVTLATMRLIHGYEKSQPKEHSLGPLRATVGVITALFHDVGYIRGIDDTEHQHGAEYTKIHVTRSGAFLEHYLAQLGMSQEAIIVKDLVHYTGYERAIETIKMDDPLFQQLGYIVGSADVIAQMADRIYLEKCRDCLYPEFEKGGLTRVLDESGEEKVIYSSKEELMIKTPIFMSMTFEDRLQKVFRSAYRYAGKHFDGPNLYLVALNKNFSYLERLLSSKRELVLRRVPATL